MFGKIKGCYTLFDLLKELLPQVHYTLLWKVKQEDSLPKVEIAGVFSQDNLFFMTTKSDLQEEATSC